MLGLGREDSPGPFTQTGMGGVDEGHGQSKSSQWPVVVVEGWQAFRGDGLHHDTVQCRGQVPLTPVLARLS